MKFTSLIIAVSIAGTHAGNRTDIAATLDPMSKPMDCFTVIANGVEFNRNSVIQRSVRVDTANEGRACANFNLAPYNRFGALYCTGDTFAIGPVRLYDADHPNIAGKPVAEYVAGLCTDYALNGQPGGYPLPLHGGNPCAGSEPDSIDNDAENYKAGYYSRTGARVARIYQGLDRAFLADDRNWDDVHSLHSFSFPEKYVNGKASGALSQIMAISTDGNSNSGPGGGGTGSTAIVGGTGIYTGARGIIFYKNFRFSSMNNEFNICLYKDTKPYRAKSEKNDAKARKLVRGDGESRDE